MAHLFRRVDPIHRAHVVRRCDVQPVVDLIDHAAHVLRWQEIQLGVARELVERAAHVALVVLGGHVVMDHIAAGTPDRLARFHVQGLTRVVAMNLDDIPRFDPRSLAQGKLNEQPGVALQDPHIRHVHRREDTDNAQSGRARDLRAALLGCVRAALLGGGEGFLEGLSIVALRPNTTTATQNAPQIPARA